MHCGLDFGTSNSTLATAKGGAPVLAPLEDGRITIPSAIFFSFEDGATRFGRDALAEYVSGADGRMMRALKSVLGTSLFAEKTRVGPRQLGFGDILGLFVRHLKREAETGLGELLDSVVVGRPVRFVDEDEVSDHEGEAQLVRAVKRQGFSHVETQFEPIAAAFDYEQTLSGEQLGLVADLGGGTCDFTVIRLSPERAKAADRKPDILSTSGVHVAGTDFDRQLSLTAIMPHLGQGTPTADGKRLLPQAPYYDLSTWHRINRLYAHASIAELRQTVREAAIPEPAQMMVAIVEDRRGHSLLSEVEAAKIALSDTDAVRFEFPVRGRAISDRIGRADFDKAIARLVERVMSAIDSAISSAGVAPAAIDTLILTGGSTRVPLIETLLRQKFPHTRFARTDAFGSVGMGLALDAERKFG